MLLGSFYSTLSYVKIGGCDAGMVVPHGCLGLGDYWMQQ